MHAAFDERRYLIPFRAALLPQIFTDVLVVGAGVAGACAALSAVRNDANADVIIAAKGQVQDSNTYWAQGGIAAVLDDADSTQSHIEDTLTAGAGLCDADIVRAVVEDGPARVRELITSGMRLDRDELGELKFGREGGHSHFRIVHTDGDATGKSLATTLNEQLREHERIRLFEDCFVLDLITNPAPGGGAGECVGAITHHPKYGLQVIWARATILAAGGCGQVYRESTNPTVATGDGIAMAYRAGAALQDMAFVQFHPTTLYIAGASRSLITEAVRGEGAILVDKAGHRFMPDYDERGELAPRDIVSRGILAQMAKTDHSHVYLDVRPIGIDKFNKRFPGIAKLVEQFGIDPATTPIPVHPSAHYMIGGVATDAEARSTLPGLYACGEASCTGLHGANRLASNSLLEGLVFGEVAGRVCLERLRPNGDAPGGQDAEPPTARPYKTVSDIRPSGRSELDLADVRRSLRSVMWRHVGIEREGDHLAEVQEMFEFWARYTLDKIFDDRMGWEVQNLLTIGALISASAAWRRESRGTHYRLDFPQPEASYRVHDRCQRGESEPTLQPVGEAAG
ncbi:MAG: L-aspartate oxidase [Planctomycetota bacterium]